MSRLTVYYNQPEHINSSARKYGICIYQERTGEIVRCGVCMAPVLLLPSLLRLVVNRVVVQSKRPDFWIETEVLLKMRIIQKWQLHHHSNASL